MDAIFYPPDQEIECDDGVLRVYLDVGSYKICIEFEGLHEDLTNLQIGQLIEKTECEVSADGPSFLDPCFRFGSQGLIFILNRDNVSDFNEEAEDNKSIEDIVEEGNAFECMPDLIQNDCFDTSEGVSATLDNLLKAISWCQNNQNFMTGKEGV